MAVEDAVVKILFVINVFSMYFLKTYNFLNASKKLKNFKNQSSENRMYKTILIFMSYFNGKGKSLSMDRFLKIGINYHLKY